MTIEQSDISNQNATPSFNLTRCYLKDASLEMPNAPQIFLDQGHPDSEMSLNVEQQDLEGGFYEVAVQLTLTTKVADKILFLVEAKQAGIFALENVPAEDLNPLLEIICAGMVYSYLRPNIADLITRAGLPPVFLNEVDFQSFYQSRMDNIDQALEESKQATQQ
ncbi:MAG: protein-export chaperone SecB [Pseudomonadota bacterium]|jgi:preprotein translocase subunit SecB